jgi:hypothetical protein
VQQSTAVALRGVLVTITGSTDTASLASLREQIDIASRGREFLPVDVSAATPGKPELFEVLADAMTRLPARLLVIGLREEVLACLDEATLWAVFALYRAGLERSSPSRLNGALVPG